MRHAILMTAYRDAALINYLIEQYPDDFQIYIHIDQKSEMAVSDIVKKNNVCIYKEFVVNWGGLNHVKAMLFLLRKALENDCDYYHWVTGQCLPISPTTFDERLNEGYSYLEYFPLSTDLEGNESILSFRKRYQLYLPYDMLDAKKSYQRYLLSKIRVIQEKLGFVRRHRNFKVLFGGSGYFSLYKTEAQILSRDAANYLSFYRHTFCAEESIIQTILINYGCENHIINDNRRYIDWNVPVGPKVLTIEDEEAIVRSNALFCRKVDFIQSRKLIKELTK